jgi:hypothetical protein
MTSFEVVVLIVGLVIGFTAAGVTSVASLKERRNRKKSRELIPLIHITQKEAANGERAASTGSTVVDIGKMLDDLTIRDYTSNPELASQIDAYFAGIKGRKDVRGDEQTQPLEKTTEAPPVQVIEFAPPLKVKVGAKDGLAIAVEIKYEGGKETQRYLVGLPGSQFYWVSSDAVSLPV